MKLSLLILILALSLSTFGQVNKIEWKTFAPPKEEFTIELPREIPMDNSNSDTEVDQTNSRSYSTEAEGAYYYIFSDNPQKAELNKLAFDFAGDHADRNKQKVLFVFSEDSGFRHRILTVKTDRRLYTFHALAQNPNDPSVKRFFKGIKINGKPVQFTEQVSRVKSGSSPTKNVESTPKTNPVSTDTGSGRRTVTGNRSAPGAGTEGVGMGKGTGGGIGSGTGTGSGSGTGSGTGIGAGKSVNSPDLPPGTTPLEIYAKPRAQYTDFARQYQVMGTVSLKVTFHASGQVTEVTPITRLPFGLTQKAIEAAKSIRFTPQKTNGQPTTVTKAIEYSFFLY